jgi:hypothetical protein
MTEPAAELPEGAGTSSRLLRAAEVLVSAHASRAKDEAARDASRIGTGAVLIVIALGFVFPALFLLNVAVVFLVEARFAWGFPASATAVAAGDLIVALVVLQLARAKLAAPVLVETRATLKRVASVVRG